MDLEVVAAHVESTAQLVQTLSQCTYSLVIILHAKLSWQDAQPRLWQSQAVQCAEGYPMLDMFAWQLQDFGAPAYYDTFQGNHAPGILLIHEQFWGDLRPCWGI